MKILLPIIFFLLTACSSDSNDPKQQIRNVLEQIELATEDRNRRNISKHIAENYQDTQQRDKSAVNNILRAYLLRNQNINLFTKIYSIEFITPRRAEIKISAAMGAKSVDLSHENERLKADLHRFTIIMEDENNSGDWKVMSAEWERGF